MDVITHPCLKCDICFTRYILENEIHVDKYPDWILILARFNYSNDPITMPV